MKCYEFHFSKYWFKCLMEGLQDRKWKFSSQQKLWWRQQWRIKLGLTLELCLPPCSCPSLVPKKSNQEASKKKNCGVKQHQFPALVSPSQQAVRLASAWSGSCCSLEIPSYLWTPQKGCALLAQAAEPLACSCLHCGWETTFLVLPFLCPSSHSYYSCKQSPAGPCGPIGKWTPPNPFWLLLSSRRGKEAPFVSEILYAMETHE